MESQQTTATSHDDARSATGPLCAVLTQLSEVIEGLSDDAYRASSPGGVDGSLGAHVRHTLDHVCLLLEGRDVGEVDYDARVRGTAVEASRDRAVALVRSCCKRLSDLESRQLQQPLCVKIMFSADGASKAIPSTMLRELAFVLSHTIHHCAMIAGIVQSQHGSVPAGFGFAPATLSYLSASSE
jgi:DinB superfamily